MTVSISSSGSTPRYDGFSENFRPPELQTPEAVEKYYRELIGSTASINSSMFSNNDGSAEWETEYTPLISKGNSSTDSISLSMFSNFDGRAEWAAEYESIISKGDGNAAVAHIIKGLQEGKLSKEEAIEFAKQVQQQANANGGGKINGGMRDALKDALGTDVDHIAKGKTRALIGFEKFWKGFLSIFGL